MLKNVANSRGTEPETIEAEQFRAKEKAKRHAAWPLTQQSSFMYASGLGC